MRQHRSKMIQLSRRIAKSIVHWASFDEIGTPHSAVSLCHPDTVEFRIFHGTLIFSTLLASLQLVNAICDVAVLLTEIRKLSWSDFAEHLIDSEALCDLQSYTVP